MFTGTISRRVVPAFLSGLLLAGFANAQKLQFNYAWWNHARNEERTGFVLGYFDCPTAPKLVYGTSSDDYIGFIDKNLKANETSSNVVPRLLNQAHLHIRPRPILKGGEEYPEKHGWLDGEWWGDATSGDADDKIGYVEGYLSCEFGSASEPQIKYLVTALNQHFGNEKNERHKIADVLQPLLDRKHQ